MATATAPAVGTRRRRSAWFAECAECATVAIDSFRHNKTRFALTALGMVIGTASLILVVTIGLTGKQYVLKQIQNIGANMIFAEYQGGAIYSAESANDYIT